MLGDSKIWNVQREPFPRDSRRLACSNSAMRHTKVWAAKLSSNGNNLAVVGACDMLRSRLVRRTKLAARIGLSIEVFELSSGRSMYR